MREKRKADLKNSTYRKITTKQKMERDSFFFFFFGTNTKLISKVVIKYVAR